MQHTQLIAIALTLLTTQPATQSTTCTCAVAKLKNAWCEACKVGYIAGVPVKYSELHEVMDAHGHEIDVSVVQCESCLKARAGDGYCEVCGLGWVRQKMYFSKLTYLVGKGKQEDTGKIECAACKKNAEKYGWCEKCGLGRVGNVSHRDRDLYKQTCEQYDFLMAALQVAARCELCACCMFTGATCPKCNIPYEKGKLPKPQSQPASPTGGT